MPQKLKEPDVTRQVGCADTTKHPQVRLEHGKQTLGSLLMSLPACILLLSMINELVYVARQRPITAGRVRIEPTAGLHGEVSGLLHCLDGEITGRLDDNSPMATDPGAMGGPVFVIMAPARLAFLASATRPAAQRFLPAMVGLPLVPRCVIEVIRFDRALHLARHFVGKSSSAQPPAPAIAGGDMAP